MLFSVSTNIEKNIFYDVFKPKCNISSLIENMKCEEDYDAKSNSTVTEDYNSNFNFHIDKFLIKETINDDININTIINNNNTFNNFEEINQESDMTYLLNKKNNENLQSKDKNAFFSKRINAFLKENTYKGSLQSFDSNNDIENELDKCSQILEKTMFPEKFSNLRCNLI